MRRACARAAPGPPAAARAGSPRPARRNPRCLRATFGVGSPIDRQPVRREAEGCRDDPFARQPVDQRLAGDAKRIGAESQPRFPIVELDPRLGAAGPDRSIHRATSQRGCETEMLSASSHWSRVASSPAAGIAGRSSADRERERLRSTPLTSPAALDLPTTRVSSTASSTTAAAGTRVRCSSWKGRAAECRELRDRASADRAWRHVRSASRGGSASAERR